MLPSKFLERVSKIIPSFSPSNLEDMFGGKVCAIRINSLKSSTETIQKELKEKNIDSELVKGINNALIVAGKDRQALTQTKLYEEGHVYFQGLASQWVSQVLGPKSGERVLDMCAAPGSKTTHMAALMKNQGEIVAIERVRGRYYKLKSVCDLLGAKIVRSFCMDARRFRLDGELFDRILVDAPCSSEGTFDINNPKSYAYWSLRKIKEMQTKQKGLLMSATRLLKPGGVLVYSTCTLSPEENEACVEWIIRKLDGRLKLISVGLEPNMEFYPHVTLWNKRSYDENLSCTRRVLPNIRQTGFFIAKFMLE